MYEKMGIHLGGASLDMTGKSNVAKCVGQECDITEDDIRDRLRYDGDDRGGDLHLNKEQAIEIAFLISKRMSRQMGLLPLTAAGAKGGGP